MYKKKFYCIDCGKQISDSRHKRCISCFGKKHSNEVSGDKNHFYKE